MEEVVYHRRFFASSAASTLTTHRHLQARTPTPPRLWPSAARKWRWAFQNPSSPLVYRRSTHIWFVDVRLMKCIANVLGLGFHQNTVSGLIPFLTFVLFFMCFMF
jgi:hypothetical protein